MRVLQGGKKRREQQQPPADQQQQQQPPAEQHQQQQQPPADQHQQQQRPVWRPQRQRRGSALQSLVAQERLAPKQAQQRKQPRKEKTYAMLGFIASVQQGDGSRLFKVRWESHKPSWEPAHLYEEEQFSADRSGAEQAACTILDAQELDVTTGKQMHFYVQWGADEPCWEPASVCGSDPRFVEWLTRHRRGGA